MKAHLCLGVTKLGAMHLMGYDAGLGSGSLELVPTKTGDDPMDAWDARVSQRMCQPGLCVTWTLNPARFPTFVFFLKV